MKGKTMDNVIQVNFGTRREVEPLPTFHEPLDTPPMMYFKRAGIYKASNVSFCPETCRAYSYSWWRFVDKIGGKVVFNNYNYSPSTNKHQQKMRRLLDFLGIKVDLNIKSPGGLQNLSSAVRCYELEIEALEALIKAPRTLKRKNLERKQEILGIKEKLKQIRTLMRKAAL